MQDAALPPHPERAAAGAASAGDDPRPPAVGLDARGLGGVRPTGPAAGRGAGVAVEVRGLVRTYDGGKLRALDGLDLDVRPGEALGLLGPNGAGKTTLMHSLSGILRPQRGSVVLPGLGVPTRARVRRAIGLAPQAVSLYGNLSAEENLRFFCRILGVARRDVPARVEEGLGLSGLEARRHDRAGNFSGGMQRRLNLACAVVHRPRLLLLDEPTAGVDPQSRGHLMGAIDGLRARGLTIVCSTHLLDEVDRLCDRVAIMDRGRVLEVDSPAALLRRHGDLDLHGLLLRMTGDALRD